MIASPGTTIMKAAGQQLQENAMYSPNLLNRNTRLSLIIIIAMSINKFTKLKQFHFFIIESLLTF